MSNDVGELKGDSPNLIVPYGNGYEILPMWWSQKI